MEDIRSSHTIPDIIFVSMENWDNIWRRNQFLCQGLVRKFPGIKILFVGLARDFSNDIRHRRLPRFTEEITQVPNLPQVYLARPFKILPNSITACRLFNENLFRNYVNNTAGKLGIKNPILWLNPHSAVHMVGKMNESPVIYDITDDWTSLTQSDSLTKLTQEQDSKLCQLADTVIVCSERLEQMKTGKCKRLELIPNGVDSKHYEAVLDDHSELPEISHSWKKPVLGYVGTIHPDRVDLELVEQIAGKLPNGSIALVGPDFLNQEQRDRLSSKGNIYLTGPVAYDEVPEIMRAFDICITPHIVSAFTESLNPIKLWEYLAAGKPIVSTNVAGFRDYKHFVTIANDADNFVAACLQSLSEDKSLPELRRAEASKNSWESRVDRVSEILVSLQSHQIQSPKLEAVHA